MAEFAPFSYGNVLAQAENIKGARTRNALLRQQQADVARQNALLANPETTPEQFIRGGLPQVGNALTQSRQLDEQTLQQHRQWLVQATQAALQNPQVWPAVLEEGKRLGVIRPDMNPAYDPEKLKQFLAQTQATLAPATAQQSQFGVVNPSDFTPESMRTFAQSGDYGDLVPVERNIFGRYNPRDYTPESLARFEQSGNPGDLVRVAPYQFQKGGAGEIIPVNPVTGQAGAPVYTAQQATEAAANRTGAEAQASARGQTEGKAQGAILAKAQNAQGVLELLDIADPLIDVATGSGTGAARDKLAGFFGVAPEGAQAIASLQVLQAGLILGMPRLEGPQSDKDRALYTEAAGQIGDPSVPRAKKKAAIATIRMIQRKYMALADRQPSTSQQFQEGQTATGPNGQKIVFRNGQWVPLNAQ